MKGWMGKIRTLSLFGFMAIILSGCGRENLTALVPKGYGAEESFKVILISIAVMTLVFIVVMTIYTYVLIRYRQKKGQENMIPKQTEGNKALEVVWTVIPILLLIIIAVPTLTTTYDLASTEGKEDAINVNVTGNQYWWHFEYQGEEIQTSQDMYIPVGEKIYLTMRSGDVIHSFWVPSISGKMDVNPENDNVMYIEAYEEGVYYGKCAELCGESHSLMDFKIVAVSQEEYDQWVTDMQNVDPEATPESTTAQEGQELFANSCLSCHAIGSSPVAVGPNLTNFGERSKIAGVLPYEKEELVEWILDPESKKPGNKMSNAPYLNDGSIGEEEADKIADYLMQLKPSEITTKSAE